MAVMSDQVNLPATIPLQDYLCNKMLESNTTVVLDDGEYHISSGPPCDISNEGNVTITGSPMKSTTVYCEGEGRMFRFSSGQRFNMERMTFINSGIYLESIENTFITNCTFSSKEATSSSKSYNDNGALKLYMDQQVMLASQTVHFGTVLHLEAVLWGWMDQGAILASQTAYFRTTVLLHFVVVL